MSHHDSLLFQKSRTTGLRTGSLSCMDVLYLSPEAPLEFLPFYLLPQHQLIRLYKSQVYNSDTSSVSCTVFPQSKVKYSFITIYLTPFNHYYPLVTTILFSVPMRFLFVFPVCSFVAFSFISHISVKSYGS